MSQPDFEFRHREGIPFEDDGFMTGSIVLPGLDMPLTLTRNQYFKFDGIVPDMWVYLRSLSLDIRYYLDKCIGDPKCRTAFNKGLVWFDYVGMIMAVRDVSPRVNLSNVAHEAAEVAVRLGHHAELETYLRKFGLKREISGLGSHEVGSIAGVLIPKSKNMDVTDLYSEQDPHTLRTLMEMGYF